MRKAVAILLLAIVGYYFINVFIHMPFGEKREGVGKYYLENTVKETGAANVVTAIVVSYRGFDTLGEVTVLFLAATGLGAILFGKRGEKRRLQGASVIVKTTSMMLYPMVVLLGAYVFVHGHLTPGGGFQGGAIIATGVLLMFMSYRHFNASHNLLTWVESLAGLTFATLGLAGLALGQTFLQNFLPLGVPNDLVSAGIIPIIYIAVGFKVGAELTGVLDNMLKTIR
jgi:multicomponent Na+:H+ antiporter subunit B